MLEELLTTRPEIVTELRTAFDNVEMGIYNLENNYFVGVHVIENPDVYEIIERRTYWCYGRYK